MVSEILSGHDPQDITDLICIDGQRWCSASHPVDFEGYSWAPLDFQAVVTNDQSSPLEISLVLPAGSYIRSPVRVARISGGELIYDAPGLSVVAIRRRTDSVSATLSLLGMRESPTARPTYQLEMYHGLRRYQDPTLPQREQWDPGRWSSEIISRARTEVSTRARTYARNEAQTLLNSKFGANAPAVATLVRGARLIGNAALGIYTVVKRRRRSIDVPDTAGLPAPSLTNQPYAGESIPQRYGRSVFAPDIAHPPYTDGSGSTATRTHVLCIGVGQYQLYKIWVGDKLAWENGAATGDVPGFTAKLYGPGEKVSARTGYITLDGSAGLNIGSSEIKGQSRYRADPVARTVEWLGSSDTAAVTPPVAGQYFYASQSLHGVVVSSTGTTSTVLGKVEEDGLYQSQAYMPPNPPLYTEIPHDRIRIVVRAKFSSQDLAIATATYSGQGQRDLPDLTTGEVGEVGTSFTTHDIDGVFDRPRLIMPRVLESSNNVTYMADISVRPLYAPEIGHPDATHLVVEYESSEDLSSATIAVDAARLVQAPGYSERIPSDGIGNCAYDAAIQVLPEEIIDVQSFIDLDQAAGADGLTCAGYSRSYTTQWALLQSILEAAAARPIFRGGKLAAVRDQDAPPKLMLTPASIAAESAELSYGERPTTLQQWSVEYTRANDGAPAERAYRLPLTLGTVAERSIVEFCGNADHAYILARYSLASSTLGGEALDLITEHEGRLVAPGDRALIAHPALGVGLASGIQRGPMTMEEGTAYPPESDLYIYIRKPDGSPWGPLRGTRGAAGDIYIDDWDAVEAELGAIELPEGGTDWAAYEAEPELWTVAETEDAAPNATRMTLVRRAGLDSKVTELTLNLAAYTRTVSAPYDAFHFDGSYGLQLPQGNINSARNESRLEVSVIPLSGVGRGIIFEEGGASRGLNARMEAGELHLASWAGALLKYDGAQASVPLGYTSHGRATHQSGGGYVYINYQHILGPGGVTNIDSHTGANGLGYTPEETRISVSATTTGPDYYTGGVRYIRRFSAPDGGIGGKYQGPLSGGTANLLMEYHADNFDGTTLVDTTGNMTTTTIGSLEKRTYGLVLNEPLPENVEFSKVTANSVAYSVRGLENGGSIILLSDPIPVGVITAGMSVDISV